MFTFHWSDYLIFGLLLIIYSIIGIYFKFKYDFKLQTNKAASKEYFLANRSMGVLPITASILVSFMSAISILGTVAEVYLSGIEYAIIGFSYFIAFPLAAYVYLPTFYKLQIGTVHQYLQLRFSKSVRILVSIVFILQMMFYMAVVLYAPSLAFSQVSGLPLWISILSTGIVCTFYTAMGGMRAVVWTDVIQFLIMLVGMIVVITFGTIVNGGAAAVWATAVKGGRINLFDFNPNPLYRHTFWSLLIGGVGMCSSIYATNQAQVQRYLSCKSEKVARRALLINVPLTFVFMWMLIGAGLVVYATFASCDPLNRDILKYDQIFPYFVMKIMHNYSPLPGLFLTTIFAAALSTVSSGINSLSNVIVEDIWFVLRDRTETVRAEKQGRIALFARIIAVCIGGVTICLAFVFRALSSTVLQISLSLFGMLGGPILATFTAGLLFPCINSIGVLTGLIICLLATLWVGLGAIFTGTTPPDIQLMKNVTGCLNNTSSLLGNQSKLVHQSLSIYQLSYLYYCFLAVTVCLIVALVVSAFTGFNNKSRISTHLVHSQIPKLSNCYPSWFSNQLIQTDEEVNDGIVIDGEGPRNLNEIEDSSTNQLVREYVTKI